MLPLFFARKHGIGELIKITWVLISNMSKNTFWKNVDKKNEKKY